MNINIDIAIDFLWDDKHFIKNDWGSITYIVGPNGTGKTVFAEHLTESLKSTSGLKVRYFGAERINQLARKWDRHGYLSSDNLSQGLNIGFFDNYRSKSEELGQSIDALIELRNKLDLQIKIESILSDIFHKKLSFEETGGYLNIKLQESNKVYDLRKDESHGLKEIITLLAFLYDDEYNCIILDEPELNLHPQFQQFILQEIKNLAGDPLQDTGKKMFVILTHSPYMLSIQSPDELKNVVVFHKNAIPTFIQNYSMLDAYQLQRLEKLLMRMNVNHKSFFFAKKPVFVEGYIDQQVFTLLQYKRGIPLGAIGVSIINVGGKDEVELMYSLCRLLSINAYCITDLDALFDGKLRQTAGRIDSTTSYLSEKGRKGLMDEIGNLESEINGIVAELISVDDSALTGEIKQFIDALKHPAGDKPLKVKQRVFAVGVHRVRAEIDGLISESSQQKITRILAIEKDILSCLQSVNIFILEKGEIENYYHSTVENHYAISDAKKTEYYEKEAQAIENMDTVTIESNYTDIVSVLDSICKRIQINTEQILSRKLGDWIHHVQATALAEPNLTVDQLIASPEIRWDSYQRIIQIIDLSHTESGFCCRFKILRNLTKNPDKILSFDEKTVAASFKV